MVHMNEKKTREQLIEELQAVRQTMRTAKTESSTDEMRLQTIMNNMVDIVAIFEADGIFRFVTPSVKRILGYEMCEMIDHNGFDFIHADDSARVIQSFSEAFEMGHKDETFRFRHSDGHYLWFEGIGRRIVESGHMPGVIVGCRDITTRKQMEEVLQTGEEAARAILNASQASIVLLDHAGIVLDSNKKHAARIQTTREALIGRCIWDYFPKAISEKRKSYFENVFVTGRAVYFEDERDGKWNDIVFEPIFDGKGNVDRVAAYIQDITERREAEEKLINSERRFRHISSITSDIIYSCESEQDGSYRINWISGATESIVGYSSDEIMIQGCWSFLVIEEDKHLFESNVIGLSPGTSASVELRLRHKDGQIVWIESNATCINHNDKHHKHILYGSCIDITERKQAEKRIRESSEQYRALFETSTQGILIYNRDRIIQMVNPAMTKLLGAESPEEVVGHKYLDFIYHDDREESQARIKQIFQAASDNPDKVYSGHVAAPVREHRLIRTNGDIVDVESTGIAFMHQNSICLQGIFRDISEHKRAEAELSESRRRLADIIEFLPDATLAINLEGRIIIWNKAIEEMTGIPAADMIGKGNYAYTIPFYGEARPQLMDLVFEDKDNIARQYPQITREGNTIMAEVFCNALYNNRGAWVVAKASPLHDQSGKIIGAIESIRDITDRKSAEGALRESEEKYRTFVEKANEAIVIAQDDILAYANPKMCEMLGKPLEVLAGNLFMKFIHPDDRAMVVDRYKRRIAGEKLPDSYEFRILGKGDVTKWVYISATLIQWEGKAATLNLLTDVTDRKQAEQALIESEERYRGIVENVIDVYYRADKEGNIMMMSPSALSVLGYGDLSELAGKNVARDIYLNPEDRNIFLSELKREGEIRDFEVTLKRKNGTPVPVSTSSRYYYGKDGSILGVEGFFRDISERKRVEQDIKERQDMEKSILSSVPHGVFGVENRKIFFANDAMEAIFGWKPEELIGKSTMVLFRNEEEWKEYGSNLYSMVAKETSVTFEPHIPFVRKDGREIFCRNSISRFGDELTEGNKIVATFEDITERKLIESQRDQQLRFTKALNEITETIISKDNSEDMLESTNRIIGETLQLDRALIYDISFEENHITGLCEWLGQDHPDIAPTKDRYPLNMFLSPFTEIKKTKRFLESHSNAVNDPFIKDGSGKILHEQMNIKSLIWYPFAFDEHGYYVFTLNQILKHRQWTKDEIYFLESAAKQVSIALIKIKILKEKEHAVATLRESEELFRVSMEKAPDGVYMNDLNGNFLYGNRKAEELIGYRREELIGRNFLDFNMIAEDSLGKASELLKANIEGKSTGPDDLEMIRKDGGRILIEVTTNVIQREGQTNVLAFVRDITERRQIEEETRLLEERLQRAEKMESLGLLAGGVAHDLNNVLGIVVGYAEMLVDEMDKSNPMRDDLKKILESGNRSAAIVQDLLALARRGVQNKKSVNINSIIKDCLKTPDFEKVFSYNQHVKLKMDLESDLLNIMGSPVHLGKTLINLVSNAVEAMHDGGVLKISTTNQYLDMPIRGYDNVREGDYVVLAVSDTGEGILERDIKRIFEPFYTKKIMGRSGTGLGLAVVWGTIKDHNGYINVESTEGKGTTFTLFFPVTREDMESEQISISMSEYMGNGETILVVDDVNRQRELASRMLTKLNYIVSTVASGEEAIEYLKNNNADLIVLDMIMDPGIDGLETYEKILKIKALQRAVIVSGFSESDRVKETQRIGAGAYVPKPYVLERLGMAVRKELDRK